MSTCPCAGNQELVDQALLKALTVTVKYCLGESKAMNLRCALPFVSFCETINGNGHHVARTNLVESLCNGSQGQLTSANLSHQSWHHPNKSCWLEIQ